MTPNERRLFDAIRNHLTPELLGANFRDRPESPFYGHCFHASIALYQVLGGKEQGYAVWKGVDCTGVSHYWLTSPSGEIIDPTAEQYTNFGIPLPYASGRRTGFRVPRAARHLVQSIPKVVAHGARPCGAEDAAA